MQNLLLNHRIGHMLILYMLGSFMLACNSRKNPSVTNDTAPIVIETSGYEVPADSILPPETRLAGEPVKLPPLETISVSISSNIHSAGMPNIIKAGLPNVCTPGSDSFLMPTIIPAKGKTFTPELPPSFDVKDAIVNDPNPFSFSSFNKIHGFRHGHILAVMEDSRGNMWFGGRGGVTRYDGKHFTQFTEKENLPDIRVSCMIEDKKGNLWFGTFGGGLAKYDGYTFTHFTQENGFPDNEVRRLFEDRNGNIWIGTTTSGIIKYDHNNFINYTYRQGLLNGAITGITEDKNGNICISSFAGLSIFDGQSFRNFGPEQGLPTKELTDIVYDRKGNIWIGSFDGACKFNGESFTHYTTKEGLPGNMVSRILEDPTGEFWIGTIGKGISKFDGNTFTNFSEKEGISDNFIWSIFQDKSKNLWIGTSNGVFNYRNNNFKHYSQREGLTKTPNSITVDKAANLWMSTDAGGFLKLDSIDGKNSLKHYTRYSTGKNDENAYLADMVWDNDGNMWVNYTIDGVLKYNNSSIVLLTNKEGLPGTRINSLLPDREGKMWFASNYGLARHDGKYFTYFTKKQGLPDNVINSMIQDKQGNFWIGTNGGAAKMVTSKTGNKTTYSITRFSKKEGLTGNTVVQILEDANGNIWFATNEGITKLTSMGGKNNSPVTLTQFTERQGVSFSYVNSILQDHKGNLWFGTRFGLNKLIPDSISRMTGSNGNKNEPANNSATKQRLPPNKVLFESYTYDDGFLGKGVAYRGLCESADGAIWIAADDRLTVFNPDNNFIVSSPPNLQLTGVRMYNQNTPWLSLENNKDTSILLENGQSIGSISFDSLSRWNYLPINLSLPYNNNFISFSYVGITTFQPKKVKYQYMLEGLDKNWSEITSVTEADYNNLSHGPYTFKVRAMNSEGNWSEAHQYSFTIRPPWWRTWWAYGIYLLLFVLVVDRMNKLQKERTIRIEREKAREKELAQAKEIEKAYTELKSTQAQLIQSEKMASLGELTAGIAHEIQNPLNFVNNFSEVSNELIDEMKDELSKGNYEDVNAIADDVKQNLEKINHHGKRADAIVKGMLQHSRQTSGTKEPTDINALCDEYLRLAYHGLRAKDNSFNATMKTDFDESIGLINVISQDIGRVLLNLYNNAFYAVNEKSKQQGESYEPTVLVSTKKNGDKVLINVKDNGNGVPQKIVDKIFQPFFTTKPTGQGTGLGLSLSYDIVKVHGGELKVETKEGEGTAFIILLPPG